MLSFVICDDNLHMVNRLSFLFEEAFSKGDFDASIVLKTTNCQELLNYVCSNKVDVIVLDIQFYNSKLTGLDIAKAIRKINKNCYIIFTTSHLEYIMQSLKLKTFDYLIKNTITVELLVETLTRLFDDFSGSSSYFMKIDSKGTFVNLNDIMFIEKDGMKLVYHTFFDAYGTYSSFSKVKDKLPHNFVRCHKSFIANVNNITSVDFSCNKITFKNNSVCYIGPKYKNDFMEVLKNNTIFE